MKRKIHKRITDFCLLIFMTLSLCACTGNAEESRKENESLAKEYVYRFQEVAMPELSRDETFDQVRNFDEVKNFDEVEMEICASTYRNGTVSLLVKVTDWENYNDNDIRILHFQDDGSGASVSLLETIPWFPAAEDDTGSSENSYDRIEDMILSSKSSYDNYTFGADGRIYAIRTFYREPQNPEEETISLHYLCCWTAEGSLLWETELEEFGSDDEYISVNTISVAEDGTASLILTGEHAWRMSVNAQGAPNPSGVRQLPDEIFQVFYNSAAIVHQEDGTLLLICYGENNWEEQYLVSYNPATDTLGTPSRMPSSSGWDGYSAIAPGPGSSLLYSNRTGIFSYAAQDTITLNTPPQNAESTKVMDFINSDLNISSFDALISLSDSSFAGLFYEGYGSKARMGIFTHVDPADVPDKSVLVLAGCYISDAVMQRVVEFNRSSEQYRIVVQNLEEYDSEEELAAGIEEMTNGIFSGNIPDILVTDGLPAETYAARGLLADIGVLIEKDEELSRTDFLQNVFDAYSIKGKLYYLIPSFEANTMIGASSIVGDRASWTFAEAMQLLKTLPEETNLIPEASRSSFLQTMFVYCGDCFIDTGTGKCSFLSQNFLDMLEYAKSLPEERNADSYGEDYWRNYEAQYREGRTLLAGMPVSSFDNAPYYVNGIFGGEEISYLGFPSEDGAGSYLKAEDSYAISSHSKYIEGAWEFLRYYLTDEYQSSLESGLPVQRKYFLESSRAALGESRAYDPEAESGTPNSLTEEQLEKLISFILSANRRYYENEVITNIVNEEAAAFFSGDKTARETAEVIQSRVQLYLDETRK